MNINKVGFKKSKFKKSRDYHKKKLNNPFFLKDNKKATAWVNSILLFIVLFGTYYAMQHTNFWQIKNVYIEGGGEITKNLALEIFNNQQLKRRFLIFTQDKIIFFNIFEFKKELEQQILLESIKVNKNIKNKTIEITLIEKKSKFFLVNQGKFFSLDNQGNIISMIESIPTTTLPIIEFKTYNLSIGAKIANIDYLDKISFINQEWPKYVKNLNIKSFEFLNNSDDKIIINTDENTGYKIYLNSDLDLNNQLNILHNLLVKIEKENIKINEYIDLSIDSWIYYK